MLYPLSYEGRMLRNPWYIYLSGPSGQVRNTVQIGFGPHLGRTVMSIHRFCEALEVIFEEMCVPIESDLRRGMTEHSLHCFDTRTS